MFWIVDQHLRDLAMMVNCLGHPEAGGWWKRKEQTFRETGKREACSQWWCAECGKKFPCVGCQQVADLEAIRTELIEVAAEVLPERP